MRKRRGIDLKRMRQRRETTTSSNETKDLLSYVIQVARDEPRTEPDDWTTISVVTLHHFFKGNAVPFKDFAYRRAIVQDELLSSLEPADGGAANLFPSPIERQTDFYVVEVGQMSEGIAEMVLWMMIEGDLTVARWDDLQLDNLEIGRFPLSPPPRSVGVLTDARALHVPSTWPLPVVCDSIGSVHSFMA